MRDDWNMERSYWILIRRRAVLERVISTMRKKVKTENMYSA